MGEVKYLVSAMIFAPIGVALSLAFMTALARLAGRDLPDRAWRIIGVAASLFIAVLALCMWLGFDPASSAEYQFVEFVPWLPEWGIHYYVGIDGFSLLLIGLSAFLFLIVLVASWDGVEDRLRSWVFCLLTLETALIGAFAALNVLQFAAFWQWVLLTIAFLVGIWGRERRVHAAVKLLGLGTVGTVLMGVASLVVHDLHTVQFGTPTFDLVAAPGATSGLIDTIIPVAGGWSCQLVLFGAFGLAFAIQAALAPFHAWLPDAHAEAPTGASVLLAGVGVELGTFGFLRFALPLFPVAAVEWSGVAMALAAGGIVYAALLALVQSDLKRIIAYTSMCQLGFVVLGLFAFNVAGLEGAVVQAIHHGVTVSALFLLAGMLHSRRQTSLLDAFGGIAKPMPVFAVLLAIAVSAGVGLPGLSGFAGQFLVLLGAFETAPALATLAIVGSGLLAAAMIWMFRRVALGPVENPENRGLIDLDLYERTLVLALVVPMFWIGVHPETLTSRLHQPVLTLRRVMLDRAAATLEAHPDPRAERATLRLAEGGISPLEARIAQRWTHGGESAP